MRSDTQTISIHADAPRLAQFLAEPLNLPRWAVGFAKSIRRDGDRWLVSTGGGEVATRVEARLDAGTIDFVMSPAPGIEVLAASRVLPSGATSTYVFTQFQAPGMSDEDFAKNVQAVKHELTVLKALLEVDCPL